MTFFIQDGWPRLADPALTRKLEFFELAQKTINDRVGAIVDALNKKYPDKVHVLPVGDGMVELVHRVLKRELPGVNRVYVPKSARRKAAGFYRDAIHPTKLVAQLEGYIYFACIYRRKPSEVSGGTALRDAKLDKILREVAWQVVTAHPHTGLKPAKGPAGGPAKRP